MAVPLGKRAAAEFFGTFWLVLGGCGSAVISAAFPGLGIGFLGVASGVRSDGGGDGSRARSYFGRPSEPGYFVWSGCGQEVSGFGFDSLHCGASGGRDCRGGSAVCDRVRERGILACGRICFQRICGTFAGRILADGLPGYGDCADFCIFAGGDGSHGSPGIFGIRGDCHWVVLDGDPSGGNSGDESFGESGAQHRTSNLRGRVGGEAAMALLGGAIDWRSAGRRSLPSDT